MLRVLILVAGLSVLLPAAALAGDPIPPGSNSDIPDWIPVVGTQLGVPHPGQSIVITIRDDFNEPIVGAVVEIDFSDCLDIGLCDAVIDGAGIVSCAFSTVTGYTDAAGQVELTVIGGATHASGTIPGPPPIVGAGCVEIRADGVVLGYASSYVLDQNGAVTNDGHTGLDLALTASDVVEFLGYGVYRARSAYAEFPEHVLTGLDLATHAVYLAQSLAGHGSASGCADGNGKQPYCP